MDLPRFKYHPDPLRTGNIQPSAVTCRCCGNARGYIYTGQVYAARDLDDSICPWCIADGGAHEKFGAEFTDPGGVGGGGQWDEVPQEVVEEVAHRTPGFRGWQQEKWFTHCGDAAEFLGRVGHAELTALGDQAVQVIRDDTGLDDGPQWKEFFQALDKDDPPTAYIFRCRKCGTYGGYQDTD